MLQNDDESCDGSVCLTAGSVCRLKQEPFHPLWLSKWRGMQHHPLTGLCSCRSTPCALMTYNLCRPSYDPALWGISSFPDTDVKPRMPGLNWTGCPGRWKDGPSIKFYNAASPRTSPSDTDFSTAALNVIVQIKVFFTVYAVRPWKCQLSCGLIEIMVACGSLPCVRFSRFSCLAGRAGGFTELSVVWMPRLAPDSLCGVLFTSRQAFIGSKGLLWSSEALPELKDDTLFLTLPFHPCPYPLPQGRKWVEVLSGTVLSATLSSP